MIRNKVIKKIALCFVCISIIVACGMSEEPTVEQGESAAVTAVIVSGEENNYTLSVSIASPDTGCDQYADWWEVFTEEGELIYRRILAHSHVDEQPFTRSGGPVNVGPNDFIYIRAHMNNLAYGKQVFSGTIGQELRVDSLDVNFAKDLETVSPLPDDCAF